MDGGPGTDLGSLGWYLGIWVTMMAAMMLPSATPMVMLFSKVSRESSRRPSIATTLFVTGYLIAWAAYGLLAFGLFRLVRAVDPSVPRLGQGRTGGRRGRDRARGGLPADPVQARLPSQLPHAAQLRDAPLARRCRRRRSNGDRAWRLVHRLLLGADGAAVRRRRDEHHLDGGGCRDRLRREGAADRRAGRRGHCRRADRPRHLGRVRARERPRPDPSGSYP